MSFWDKISLSAIKNSVEPFLHIVDLICVRDIPLCSMTVGVQLHESIFEINFIRIRVDKAIDLILLLNLFKSERTIQQKNKNRKSQGVKSRQKLISYPF